MAYSVKEIYYTLQGEGAQAGRPAVFCRLAGCNLWSGLEAERAEAICTFCDTDFLGTDGPGGATLATAEQLAQAVAARWPRALEGARPLVVCTGGEPLLQLDEPAIEALHTAGFQVAVETNGTRSVPAGVDWVCVSPKAGAPLRVHSGDELKLVYPQAGLDPELFANLDFTHFFLQPMDSPERAANTRAVHRYCLRHPRWQVSLQLHKMLAIA